MPTLTIDQSPPVQNGVRKTTAARSRSADTPTVSISVVEQNGRRLRFKNPFVFSPFMDASGRWFVVEEARLGLSVFSPSHAQISNELKTELSFLWDEYALADDGDLSSDAIVLKQNLLSFLEVDGE